MKTRTTAKTNIMCLERHVEPEEKTILSRDPVDY